MDGNGNRMERFGYPLCVVKVFECERPGLQQDLSMS